MLERAQGAKGPMYNRNLSDIGAELSREQAEIFAVLYLPRVVLVPKKDRFVAVHLAYQTLEVEVRYCHSIARGLRIWIAISLALLDFCEVLYLLLGIRNRPRIVQCPACEGHS
jgi:hypothetical protein